jgi:hypothetical protein
MSKEKKTEVDSETILLTLDQIGQTVEIMDKVVNRLRGYINDQIEPPHTSLNNEFAEIPHPHIKRSQSLH